MADLTAQAQHFLVTILQPPMMVVTVLELASNQEQDI
jgi:hypothetical protein